MASKAILSQYSQRLAKLECLFKNSDENLNETFKKVRTKTKKIRFPQFTEFERKINLPFVNSLENERHRSTARLYSEAHKRSEEE